MTRRTAENKRSGNGAEPGFEKGASGNPARRFGQPEGNPTDRGGRPKSLAGAIREKIGDDGDALISELLKVAKGRARTAVKVAAIRELLDRGFGRAVTPVELSGPGGRAIEVIDREREHQRAFAGFLTDDELAQWEEIATRVEDRMRAAGALPPAEDKPAPPLPLSPSVAMARMGTPPRQRL